MGPRGYRSESGFRFLNSMHKAAEAQTEDFYRIFFRELSADCVGIESAAEAPDGVAERLNAVSAQMQHNGVVEDLIFEEIAFSPPYSLAKDIVNNAGSLAQEILEGNLRTIEFADLEAGVLPVDIRSPEVFAKGHLPGAINFPLANLRDSLTNLPKDRKIALYCNHGYGAYLAYQILSQQGFDNAYLLSPSTLLN